MGSPVRVGLTQSLEGLKRTKGHPPPSKRILQPDGFSTGTLALPAGWPLDSNPDSSSADPELVSLHNGVNQLLRVKLPQIWIYSWKEKYVNVDPPHVASLWRNLIQISENKTCILDHLFYKDLWAGELPRQPETGTGLECEPTWSHHGSRHPSSHVYQVHLLHLRDPASPSEIGNQVLEGVSDTTLCSPLATKKNREGGPNKTK